MCFLAKRFKCESLKAETLLYRTLCSWSAQQSSIKSLKQYRFVFRAMLSATKQHFSCRISQHIVPRARVMQEKRAQVGLQDLRRKQSQKRKRRRRKKKMKRRKKMKMRNE